MEDLGNNKIPFNTKDRDHQRKRLFFLQKTILLSMDTVNEWNQQV